MCDTIVALGSASADGVTLFAKNSDRDPREAHEIVRVPAARHPAGATIRCTYEPIRKLVGVEKGSAFRYKWVVKRLTKTEMRLEKTYYHKTGSGELSPSAAQSVAPCEAPTAAGTAASPTGPAAHCQSARAEWDLVHLVDRLPMEGCAS